MAKAINKVTKFGVDIAPGGRQLEKFAEKQGIMDPLKAQEQAENEAVAAAKQQQKLLAEQKQREQLELAEQESALSERRDLSRRRRAGGSSLIRTSARGLIQ